MKHHFADFLDRDGNYWTIVPNRKRYSSELSSADGETKILTLYGSDNDYERVKDLPGLEELTLHEPSKKQLSFLSELTQLRRLRISHARPRDLGFIEPLVNVEQLVLEYVSGFSELSPLSGLSKLRALHTENLRKVTDFAGLSGLDSLRFLSVYGTLDWKQPVADFEFIRGIPNLEILSMWQVINKTAFPATLPVLSLKRLKRIKMAWNVLSTEEYALLEAGLPHVSGADWGPYTEFKRAEGDVWFEFTGKGAGATKFGSKNAETRCAQFAEKYTQMKDRAAQLIKDTQPENAADGKTRR